MLGALVAALEQIATEKGEPAATSELARTCIMLADILDTDSLQEWNDAPARTAAEVLNALERAGTALKIGEHDDA